MDSGKAYRIAGLIKDKVYHEDAVRDFGVMIRNSFPDSEVTVKIPARWLYSLVELASAELEEINKEIDDI